MTEPPLDRDGSPSVAALAVHVDGLRREVESLAAKVDTLVSTQQEHTVVLDDITELHHQVEQILATLTEEDDASPAEWFWLRMNEQVREERFAELSDWVETVLRTQYPDYLADQIRPRWPNHPEARWELAWLYQQWSLTYPRQATSTQRRSGVARPLVTRTTPPERSNAPMRRKLPARTHSQLIFTRYGMSDAQLGQGKPTQHSSPAL